MTEAFVTRKLPEPALDLILAHCDAEVWQEDELPPPRAVLLEKAANVRGLLTLLTDKVDAELLAGAPHLRVVSNYAVGFDNIDVPQATARGVVVGNTPGVLTETTADMAFALLLAAGRRLVEGDRLVRAGRWQTWSPTMLLGQDIHGATLGLLGLGRIGEAVARRARGFTMRLLYHSRSRRRALEDELGMRYVGLDALLAESDFVSLHVPLTAETRGLINAETLRRMKPTAVLVNTARGAVVDQGALAEALRAGVIAAAALDVTDPEPIARDDPLLALENCIVVPHIASASVATRTRMGLMAAENLLAGLRGEMPPNPVNPEAMAGQSQR
jgi:glyoxylate reductase